MNQKRKKTESLSQVLSTKYSEDKSSNKVLSTKYLTPIEIKERAMIIAGDMASEEWCSWYCKAFTTLGEQRYTVIAHTAKTGKNPRTLFGWLLKQEMKQVLAKRKTA